MKRNNICKFTSSSAGATLTTRAYVLETKFETQSCESILDTNRLLLVTEGAGRFSLDRTCVDCGKGDLLLLRSGTLFSVTDGKDLQYLYIEFLGERADELFRRYGVSGWGEVYHGHQPLIPILRDSLTFAEGEGADLLAESMVLFTFSKLGKKADKPREKAETLHAYVEENFPDRTLTLSAMAKGLGYNEKYLSHLFVKEMGVPFSDYLTGIRLREALRLIGQGMTSVKNISILSGFSDPLYFSKVFKAKFDLSPKDFIKRAEEESESSR